MQIQTETIAAIVLFALAVLAACYIVYGTMVKNPSPRGLLGPNPYLGQEVGKPLYRKPKAKKKSTKRKR